MLLRFSLYGFLKNQRYFEPFFLLVFLDKGLSFFEIGLLIAVREAAVNLLEIPSGAIADVFGRRGLLVLSFVAYIASFAAFGFADGIWPLAGAMLLYAVGESFRTGTHKAMIFAWLRREGRTEERTRVYGYTRSWSKFGSALSVVLAGAIVVLSDNYDYVFFCAIPPYVLGIVNLLGYPGDLENKRDRRASVREVGRRIRASVGDALRRPGLRRLVLESMGFEGVLNAAKDYLQPALMAAAITLGAGLALTDTISQTRRTGVLIGVVYFALYVVSGFASRHSHALAASAGGEARASRLLWACAAIGYSALLVAGLFDLVVVVILAFVLLHVLQNLWRPILIGRFDEYASASEGATVLSIESQAKRASTMVFAPLLGLTIDAATSSGAATVVWPIGLAGGVVAFAFCVSLPRSSRGPHASERPAVAAPGDD